LILLFFQEAQPEWIPPFWQLPDQSSALSAQEPPHSKNPDELEEEKVREKEEAHFGRLELVMGTQRNLQDQDERAGQDNRKILPPQTEDQTTIKLRFGTWVH
jgi:hypothetical protein